MPKKFALIGTSCTGKTTLIYMLKNAMENKKPKKKIIIAEEAARKYFEGKNIENRFSFFHQKNIQNLAQEIELKAQENADYVLCDRSVLDAAAYVHATGKKQNTKRLLGRMDAWLKTYTHLFLLDPKDIDYKIDSIRKEHKKTRGKFHQSFLEILSNSHLPWTLISGTTYERIPKMMKIIEST